MVVEMNTGINRFCKKYLMKLEDAKKQLEEKTANITSPFFTKETIDFKVCLNVSYPLAYVGGNDISLFTLDEDDLKYLYDKYSKKLQEEMERNIEEVKKMYNQ